MIILNERIVAEKLIRDGLTYNHHALQQALIIMKYYKAKGVSREDMHEMVEQHIKLEHDSDGIIASKLAGVVLNHYNTCAALRDQPIPIYQEDMDLISTLKRDTLKKILFVLIVLSRCFGNSIQFRNKELMRLSKTSRTSHFCIDCIHSLHNLGYVDTFIDKVKYGSVKKTIACRRLRYDIYNPENPTLLFEVKNTNNPITFYEAYINGTPIEDCEKQNQFAYPI